MEDLVYKTLVIDKGNKLCTIDGQEVPLTKKEYTFLTFLISNPNHIYSRQELLKDVLKVSTSIRSIDTSVSRLRKKLGPYAANLVTRMGFGYGFKMER